eukprot:TRINITY_DN4046_c0_g1_i1.p1 TRINITY_DN4046_c0_g1~~TRINITY_DN4046_c0_g1_i1.p1  ORF type:complete len:134 (-),score=15.20 TRINITY_DN4046_c0_g1_i1:80-481(-)
MNQPTSSTNAYHFEREVPIFRYLIRVLLVLSSERKDLSPVRTPVINLILELDEMRFTVGSPTPSKEDANNKLVIADDSLQLSDGSIGVVLACNRLCVRLHTSLGVKGADVAIAHHTGGRVGHREVILRSAPST